MPSVSSILFMCLLVCIYFYFTFEQEWKTNHQECRYTTAAIFCVHMTSSEWSEVITAKFDVVNSLVCSCLECINNPPSVSWFFLWESPKEAQFHFNSLHLESRCFSHDSDLMTVGEGGNKDQHILIFKCCLFCHKYFVLINAYISFNKCILFHLQLLLFTNILMLLLTTIFTLYTLYCLLQYTHIDLVVFMWYHNIQKSL